MQEFLYLEKCAENNTITDLSNVDPLYLFELGIEYLNINMFTKSLESYNITPSDIKYIKKRLIYEVNDTKPNYDLIISFLNKVISSSSNFRRSDEFLPLLTNIFNTKFRDSVFGNLVMKLSKEILIEYSNQLIDVALYNGYSKSLKMLFKKLDIHKDYEKLIKECKIYRDGDIDAIAVCNRILKKNNKMDMFKEINEYANKAINKQTRYAFYLSRSLMI